MTSNRRTEGRKVKERKRKIASLRAARCKRWGKRGGTRIRQTTRKEVVKKRGKFGTSADVHSRGVRSHDGFLFSLPFSRDARFSSWNSKIRRGGNERVIAYPRCNIVRWIASLTLFLPRSVLWVNRYLLSEIHQDLPRCLGNTLFLWWIDRCNEKYTKLGRYLP